MKVGVVDGHIALPSTSEITSELTTVLTLTNYDKDQVLHLSSSNHTLTTLFLL